MTCTVAKGEGPEIDHLRVGIEFGAGETS